MTNVIIRLKTNEIYKLVRNLLVRAFHSLLTLFAVSLLFNENDTVINAILIVALILFTLYPKLGTYVILLLRFDQTECKFLLPSFSL